MNATFQTGLATCRCRNCDHKIEFHSDEAGREASCPHCGLEILLYIPQSLATANARGHSRPWGITLRMVIILSITVVVFLGVAVWAGQELIEALGIAASGLVFFGLLAFWVFLILLAILWLVFPLFVYFLLRRIERNTRKQ